MASIIEQLTNIVQQVDTLILSLSNIPLLNNNSHELDRIAGRLHDAATTIEKRTGSFRHSREDAAWEATETLRKNSQSIIEKLHVDGKLKNKATLSRNLVLIFCGPRHLALDSKTTKTKKKATQYRCGKLREAEPRWGAYLGNFL